MVSADYRALIKQAEQAVTAVNDPEFKRAAQLSDLGSAALAEQKWRLSRNAKTCLPKLREIGHQSAPVVTIMHGAKTLTRSSPAAGS